MMTHEVYTYIQDKRYKNYISTEPQNFDINQAALNLGFQVSGNPEHRKEGSKAIVNMSENQDLLKHLSLAYYANQMSVYFKYESMIAHSITYTLKKNNTKSVHLN